MKYLILTLLVLMSCGENGPHGDGMKYIYKVKYSKSEFIDTLKLERNSISGFISNVKWDSEIRQDKGSSTGIEVETKTSNSTIVLELPHPLGEYLNYTNLLPAPKVQFPIQVGDSIYMSHKVNYKHSPHNGREIDGYLKVIGKEYYPNVLIKDTCWVLKANRFGVTDTSATFYYNPKFGFVYFHYQIGIDEIEINLNSIAVTE